MDSWEQGALSIKPGDLSMQGTAQKWLKAIDKARGNHSSNPEHTAGPLPLGACSGGRDEGKLDDSMQITPYDQHDSDQLPPIPLQDQVRDDEAAVHADMDLKQIVCPTCGKENGVGSMGLCTKTGFSKVKCRAADCGDVQVSSLWRCRCRVPWTRCPRHVHSETRRAARKP